jgi:hypothetical protein
LEGGLAIYMNYPYYVEFFDTMLCKLTQKNMNASILQQNLFVVLTSSEMVALSQLNSILYIGIIMSFQFLAEKTHQFKAYNWRAADMARVLANI